MAISGHKQAITDCAWTADGAHLLSASADKTARLFDAETGTPLRRFTHPAIVNSVSPAREGVLFATGADDGCCRLWDTRVKRCVQTLGEGRGAAVTAVVCAGETVFAGGLDNKVVAYDPRTGDDTLTLVGHTETVTGLALSPDGSFLLSNAMDATLRVWDVRPYAPAERCVRVMTGHAHNFEKQLLRCAWSADGKMVACGSSDRCLWIFAAEGSVLYKLPGHKSTVTAVAFHPSEPIVGSTGSDKQIFLGELE